MRNARQQPQFSSIKRERATPTGCVSRTDRVDSLSTTDSAVFGVGQDWRCAVRVVRCDALRSEAALPLLRTHSAHTHSLELRVDTYNIVVYSHYTTRKHVRVCRTCFQRYNVRITWVYACICACVCARALARARTTNVTRPRSVEQPAPTIPGIIRSNRRRLALYFMCVLLVPEIRATTTRVFYSSVRLPLYCGCWMLDAADRV